MRKIERLILKEERTESKGVWEKLNEKERKKEKRK
jgi:hypothetical protein